MATSERLEECDERLRSLLRELEGLISVTLPACTGGKEHFTVHFGKVALISLARRTKTPSKPRRKEDWRCWKTGTQTTEVIFV